MLGTLAALRENQAKAVELENEMAYAIAMPHIQRAIDARDFKACAPFLDAIQFGSRWYDRARTHIARAMAQAPHAQVPLSTWKDLFKVNDAQALRLRRDAI